MMLCAYTIVITCYTNGNSYVFMCLSHALLICYTHTHKAVRVLMHTQHIHTTHTHIHTHKTQHTHNTHTQPLYMSDWNNNNNNTLYFIKEFKML